MKFFSPWSFWGLLSVPIIIMKYLLKQKYQELKVPSLFLWNQALEKSQAYRPWQKLRKNLLMFLQVLIACLLVLTLTKPYLVGMGREAENVILILDQSMSMQTQYETSNRFKTAKKQMKDFIEGMKPGTQVSVIIMGNEPYMLVNQSTDKSLLLRKIKDVKVTNMPVDLENTMILVKGLYEQTKAQTYLFSDQTYFAKDVPIKTFLIGEPEDNTGITLLSHSVEEKQIAVLVKVKNFGQQLIKQSVSLYGDEALIDVKEIEMKPGKEKNIFFTGISTDTKILKAQLEKKEALDVDDVAYDVVQPSIKEKVLLVTEQNVFLEQVLSILPRIELYKTKKEDQQDLKGYHLYIFDGFVPDKLPQDGHILVFHPQPGNSLIHTEEDVEIEYMHPGKGELLQFIKEFNFALKKARKMKTPDWAREIVEANSTPLIVAGDKQGQKILVCGFDLHETDLPLKKEFPIFMYNLAQWFIPQKIYNLDKITAGDQVEFQLSPEAKEINVIQPDGEMISLAPPFPVDPYKQTNQLGIYVLEQKGEKENTYHSFAVNPPINQESDLYQRSVEKEKEQAEVQTPEVVGANKNLSDILLLLVIGILIIEWWVYVRERSF
jgi:hypothetical protein